MYKDKAWIIFNTGKLIKQRNFSIVGRLKAFIKQWELKERKHAYIHCQVS